MIVCMIGVLERFRLPCGRSAGLFLFAVGECVNGRALALAMVLGGDKRFLPGRHGPLNLASLLCPSCAEQGGKRPD